MSNTCQLSMNIAYLIRKEKKSSRSMIKNFFFSFFFLGHSDDFNFRNFFSNAIKTPQDQNFLTQLEQRLPQFLDLDSK